MRNKIVTLTLNPALDKSVKIDGIVPDHKLKCHSVNYQPGGGGINITRVLNRLGVTSFAVFPYGGNSGMSLNELLIKENIKPESIPIKAWTRENLSVIETNTGLQYRFGMPGNILSDSELIEIEAALEKLLEENDLFVLSGSIAKEMPIDYYVKLIRRLADKNIKVVLDTSGPALNEALKENIYLIKPNQRELAQLAGKDFLSREEQEKFALEIIKSQKVMYVVVSLGARGAFIASNDGITYQTTPSVSVKSTIGAGDSMVAGLIYAIQNNCSAELMLKWGVACGVAATMNEGTGLANKENIDKVFTMLNT
jgi:6-phosphofructokinase 2